MSQKRQKKGRMDEEYISWRCKNPLCQEVNRVLRIDIENKMKEGHKPLSLCGSCGYVKEHGGIEDESYEGEIFDCNPYTHSKRALPTKPTPKGWFPIEYVPGIIPPDGGWKDLEKGVGLSRDGYTKKYGVDPEINWAWQEKRRSVNKNFDNELRIIVVEKW